MKKLKWRVIYGYSDNDYISIGGDYLERAKYAMLSGKLFNYEIKTIRGSEIKRIEPDYRYYTGWNDSYKFGGGGDTKQINRDVPLKEIKDRTRLADNRVRYALNKGQINLLNDVSSLDRLLINSKN